MGQVFKNVLICTYSTVYIIGQETFAQRSSCLSSCKAAAAIIGCSVAFFFLVCIIKINGKIPYRFAIFKSIRVVRTILSSYLPIDLLQIAITKGKHKMFSASPVAYSSCNKRTFCGHIHV